MQSFVIFCNFWRTDRHTDRQTDLGIKAPSRSLKRNQPLCLKHGKGRGRNKKKNQKNDLRVVMMLQVWDAVTNAEALQFIRSKIEHKSR